MALQYQLALKGIIYFTLLKTFCHSLPVNNNKVETNLTIEDSLPGAPQNITTNLNKNYNLSNVIKGLIFNHNESPIKSDALPNQSLSLLPKEKGISASHLDIPKAEQLPESSVNNVVDDVSNVNNSKKEISTKITEPPKPIKNILDTKLNSDQEKSAQGSDSAGVEKVPLETQNGTRNQSNSIAKTEMKETPKTNDKQESSLASAVNEFTSTTNKMNEQSQGSGTNLNKIENDDIDRAKEKEKLEAKLNKPFDYGADNSEDYQNFKPGPLDNYPTGNIQKDIVNPQKTVFPNKNYEIYDDANSHFFAYFLTMMVMAVIFYLLFHNKQRIIALMIEGRGTRQNRRSTRAKYHKLDNNLEEAMSSTRGLSGDLARVY